MVFWDDKSYRKQANSLDYSNIHFVVSNNSLIICGEKPSFTLYILVTKITRFLLRMGTELCLSNNSGNENCLSW